MPSERTVRCRQWGLCRGTEQCPVGTDSDAIRCLASTAGKASYLIVEPLVLRSPGGRGAMQHPRPHQNKKRGVVSYRFRKLEKSILGLQICSLFPRAGVLCHGRVPCGYPWCDRCESAADYVTDSNGAKQVILTSATDPAKVMSLSGIQSEEGDQVYYTAFSGNLATLNIERAFSVNIQLTARPTR